MCHHAQESHVHFIPFTSQNSLKSSTAEETFMYLSLSSAKISLGTSVPFTSTQNS